MRVPLEGRQAYRLDGPIVKGQATTQIELEAHDWHVVTGLRTSFFHHLQSHLHTLRDNEKKEEEAPWDIGYPDKLYAGPLGWYSGLWIVRATLAVGMDIEDLRGDYQRLKEEEFVRQAELESEKPSMDDVIIDGDFL